MRADGARHANDLNMQRQRFAGAERLTPVRRRWGAFQPVLYEQRKVGQIDLAIKIETARGGLFGHNQKVNYLVATRTPTAST